MTDAKDWRDDLIEAHPTLFRPPGGDPAAAQGYPACEDGWRDLLERVCMRIEAVLVESGGSCRVLQIKEKLGTLRFYWSGEMSDDAKLRVEEAIALANARSACTCETCGVEGRLYDRGGWLATACAEHAEGEPVPVSPGFENLHLVYAFGPHPRGFRIAFCRRYIRDTDSFIDVDPKSLGIEE
jgi:hypothetical protein